MFAWSVISPLHEPTPQGYSPTPSGGLTGVVRTRFHFLHQSQALGVIELVRGADLACRDLLFVNTGTFRSAASPAFLHIV
ncbi:hypothetical protein D3C72_2412460 [compost metagenome]